MKAHAGWLRNILAVFAVTCVVTLSGGAAKATSITYNGEPVFDIVDSDFIPLAVDDTGTVSRIYRNMTQSIIDTLRLVFLKPLAQDPDVRGGSVLHATVDEVIYSDLNIQTEQLFRLRLIGLVPKSRFALASNNTAPLAQSEIERIFNEFDSPPVGQGTNGQIPLPFPILLLGSGLVLLWGFRLKSRGLRN